MDTSETIAQQVAYDNRVNTLRRERLDREQRRLEREAQVRAALEEQAAER